MVDESDARDAPHGETPPNGWEAPRGGHADADPGLELLKRLLTELFSLAPGELRVHLVEAARALLAALRALLDWLTARLGACGAHAASTEVRDIPIV